MSKHLTLSEELSWRGFVNQTTFKDVSAIDGKPLTFYWGVDPSADSMTVGNLAIAIMVRHFIAHGHRAILLVGGATGLIGDPDGKAEERDLKPLEEVARNKKAIAAQYKQIFAGEKFEIVDNYDWFKGIGFLEFLRDVGKHVPMRQMLGREFVQSRLNEDGAGISYAEFSYSLIQGYDFLHLYRTQGVTLQVCGADQWGNSIAGVELIRRIAGGEAHIWSAPLVVNKATGVKFGKTEAGAIWLDPAKTTPTQFYQFWINLGDEGVGEYLKIYTELSQSEIGDIMAKHVDSPDQRLAQTRLAQEVTKLVHGEAEMKVAETVTAVLTGKQSVGEVDKAVLPKLRAELPAVRSARDGLIADALVESQLASSRTEARRLIMNGAVYINGQKALREAFGPEDFQDGRLLLRRGKAFKDSALVELA